VIRLREIQRAAATSCRSPLIFGVTVALSLTATTVIAAAAQDVYINVQGIKGPQPKPQNAAPRINPRIPRADVTVRRTGPTPRIKDRLWRP
jgi:hypothetical protein